MAEGLDSGRSSESGTQPKMDLVLARSAADEESPPPLLHVLGAWALRSFVRRSLDALLFIPTGGAPLRPRR